MKNPKFKVGNKVTHPHTLYNETEGEIVEVERVYAAVYDNGAFEPRGLQHLESTIKSIQLPYRFDGKTLEVDMPADRFNSMAVTLVSRFHGYAYTVKTPEMRSIFSEKRLSLR